MKKAGRKEEKIMHQLREVKELQARGEVDCRGTQVIIEGPGHVPFDQIPAYL